MDSEFQLIINLAKARALLLHDASTHMPTDAHAQRRRAIETLETLIDDLYRPHHGSLPAMPEHLDAISADAWRYVATLPQHPPAPQPTEISAYGHLKHVFGQRGQLKYANEIIAWMADTHTATSQTIDKQVIADSRAAMEVLEHRLIAQPNIRAWLDATKEGIANLSASDQRNYHLMYHQWLAEAGLDTALVNNLSLATSDSADAWETAKESNRFNDWLPHFKKVVALTQQKGTAMGAALGVSPYQALLNVYNPELNNDTVNQMFAELRQKLPGLIQRIIDKQANETPPLPLPPIPETVQERIAQRIITQMGLTEKNSRLDISAHPFSAGSHDDLRIATCSGEDDWLSNLMAVIHETGHALYAHNRPRDDNNQPLGEAQSMWVHETQSLFWEQQVARSIAFMEFLSPIIKEEVHASCPDLDMNDPTWSPENLQKRVTRVKADFIRVDADEVTYTAHILLRHDLEQQLVAGTLQPEDVPAAWNTGMKALLGLDVPTDSMGCMQDVHWPIGYIGYFPAYSFGMLGAAQLMEKLQQDIPNVNDCVREGNFAPLRDWLAHHIHQQGSVYSGEALIARATGKPLSVAPLLNHLSSRYMGNAIAAETPGNTLLTIAKAVKPPTTRALD